MGYKYAQVEQALIDTLQIEDGHLGSFRAKVRRLRELDIPQLPKVGSGVQVEWEERHVVDLAAALTLDRLGVPPKASKPPLNIMRHCLDSPDRKKGTELYVVIEFIDAGKHAAGAGIHSRASMLKLVASMEAAIVVNITAIEASVKKALK